MSLLWLVANVLLIVLMILGSEIFYGCLVGENRNRNSVKSENIETGTFYILSLKRRFPLQILPKPLHRRLDG